MRFYIDEDLSHEIAVIARNLGVDVIASHESGNEGKPDDVQLAIATSLERCILTNNRDHFLALSLQYAEQGLSHTDILLLARSLPPNSFTAITYALVHYAREHPEDVYHHTDWLHPAPNT
jgi:predicted nuclease of predicted toxin-antitoxin system